MFSISLAVRFVIDVLTDYEFGDEDWMEGESNGKTFFPTEYTGDSSLIMPECHEETGSPVAFPVHFGLGISFKAVGVSSCESFGSRTGGFGFQASQPSIFSNAFSRPRICPE